MFRPPGNDANDGKSADPAHAWRTISHGARSLACGQVLIVMGGSYANEQIEMNQGCTAEAKAVVLVNPGDTATVVSQPPGSGRVLECRGGIWWLMDSRWPRPALRPGEYDAQVSAAATMRC